MVCDTPLTGRIRMLARTFSCFGMAGGSPCESEDREGAPGCQCRFRPRRAAGESNFRAGRKRSVLGDDDHAFADRVAVAVGLDDALDVSDRRSVADPGVL